MRLPVSSLLALIAATLLAACSAGSDGISDGKIVDALGLESQAGAYVMNGNAAFCSVAKLLHDSGEVHDAAKDKPVIASKDGSVGIQVITPFAPDCRKDAERKLDKLARKG